VKGGQFSLTVATALLPGCPGPVMRNVSQTDIAGYLTDRGANRKLESEPFLRSLGWFPTLACFVIDTGI